MSSPVSHARYDHATGRLVILLHASEIEPGTPCRVVSQGLNETATVQPWRPSLHQLVCPRTLLTLDPFSLWVIVGDDAFSIVRSEIEVRNWYEDRRDAVDLSVLLSFPRSGSKWVQSVIRANSPVAVGAVYARPAISGMRINLKSHAASPQVLADELEALWRWRAQPSRTIRLVRDPRDVMISLLDHIRGRWGYEARAEDLPRLDYYEYAVKVQGYPRTGVPSATTIFDALREWVRNWGGPAQDDSIVVRFEDLAGDPRAAFGRVFEHLGLEMPAELKDLDKLVSQNGESDRPRGQASGWRAADKAYFPVIEAVERDLAPEIRALGYA